MSAPRRGRWLPLVALALAAVLALAPSIGRAGRAAAETGVVRPRLRPVSAPVRRTPDDRHALAPASVPPTLVYTKSALTGGHPAEEGIWEMGSDGSDPHQVLAVGDPGAATLSPDGTEVALARGNGDTIEVAPLSGVPPVSFTVPDPSGIGIVSLRWSPVGNLLAYSVVGTTGALVAYTIGVDGTDPRQVADPGGNPSWSPDGRSLVVDNAGWYDNTTDGGLFVVDLADGNERQIVWQPGSPGAPAQPAWSPNGARVAFDGTGGLSIVGAAGGPVTTLGVQGAAPVWSADSSALAFGATRNGNTVSIFTVSGGGADETDIDPGNVGYDDTPVAYLPSATSAPVPVAGVGAPATGAAATCGAALPDGDIAGMAPSDDGRGYVIVDSRGDVVPCGDAPFHGSLRGGPLTAPIVGVAGDPVTGGYWLVAADGGVFAYGAPFFGSMASHRLDRPVVGMAATGDAEGYWLVAADGGVFAFGDARFVGAMGGRPLVAPVVAVVADDGTGGYWLMAADGGVFAFGAPFDGAVAVRPLARPVVGAAGGPNGHGYRLVAADGGLFAEGAAFSGAMAGHPMAAPAVALAPDPRTGGYWILGADGGIFAFDAPYCGSAAPR